MGAAFSQRLRTTMVEAGITAAAAKETAFQAMRRLKSEKSWLLNQNAPDESEDGAEGTVVATPIAEQLTVEFAATGSSRLASRRGSWKWEQNKAPLAATRAHVFESLTDELQAVREAQAADNSSLEDEESEDESDSSSDSKYWYEELEPISDFFPSHQKELDLLDLFEVFDLMDDDHGGTISVKEYVAAIMKFGYRRPNCDLLFLLMDQDGGGTVSSEEFVSALVAMRGRAARSAGNNLSKPRGDNTMPPRPRGVTIAPGGAGGGASAKGHGGLPTAPKDQHADFGRGGESVATASTTFPGSPVRRPSVGGGPTISVDEEEEPSEDNDAPSTVERRPSMIILGGTGSRKSERRDTVCESGKVWRETINAEELAKKFRISTALLGREDSEEEEDGAVSASEASSADEQYPFQGVTHQESTRRATMRLTVMGRRSTEEVEVAREQDQS